MKKNVIKIFMIFIIITVFFITQAPRALADDVTIPSIMDDFSDDLNPEETQSSNVDNLATPFTDLIKTVVQKILGAIQVIGGLLTIVSVAIYGMMMLFNSQPDVMKDLGIGGGPFGGYDPNTRKELLKYIKRLIIGAALLFSSSSIVVFVMGVLL